MTVAGSRLRARGSRVLLALSLLAATAAAAARNTSQLAEKIDADLEAWDIEGAQRGLDDLAAHDSGSVAAAYFRARVLFEEGKYADSAVAYAEARSRGSGGIDGFEAQGIHSGHQCHVRPLREERVDALECRIRVYLIG